MRKAVLGLATAGLLVTGYLVSSLTSASAITSGQTFRLTERDTATDFIDQGAKGRSLGDRLVGAADLFDRAGAKVGRDSFVCDSVSRNDTRFQCAVVYELRAGRVTTQGSITLGRGRPLFDELFPVSGGSQAYQNVRGQVRIIQHDSSHADVVFTLIP